MLNTEVAWAAGFFDGEGNTHFSGRNRFVLSISQTAIEPLERFKNAFGEYVKKVNGPYTPKTARSKSYWSISISGERARTVISTMRPYLCSIKLRQADEALKKFDQHLNRPRKNSKRLLPREIFQANIHLDNHTIAKKFGLKYDIVAYYRRKERVS